MYSLSAPEFFKKANRIMYYAGAVQMRMKHELGRREPEPEAIAAANDPDLADLIEYG